MSVFYPVHEGFFGDFQCPMMVQELNCTHFWFSAYQNVLNWFKWLYLKIFALLLFPVLSIFSFSAQKLEIDNTGNNDNANVFQSLSAYVSASKDFTRCRFEMWHGLKVELNSLDYKEPLQLDSCVGLQMKTSGLNLALLPDYKYAAGFIHCKNKPDQAKWQIKS